MKRILVSGYIGFNNFGDEAIFEALNSHLKNKGHKVSVLCKDKNASYDNVKYNYKSPFEILKAILNSDILISGGGSLLQNKTSNFSLIYYLFIIVLAKLFLKKVIIFAQGIEPIKGKFFENLTAFIIKKADMITVRDEKSKNYLESLNIKNVILLSDPVYSLIQERKINENKEGLIIQLRDFKGFNYAFLNDLAQIVSKYYNDELKVLSLQDDYDKNVCQKFVEILKERNIKAELIYSKSVDEIIEILDRAKFVISTRLHGIIVAHALNSKVFALSYDDKIKTIVEELNLNSINLYEYKKEELDKKIDEFLNSNINEAHPYRRFDWKIADSFIEKEK